MLYRIIKYKLLLLIVFVFTISFNKIAPPKGMDVMGRLVVKLVPSHNAVTADTSSQSKSLNLMLLEPMKGLDFRTHKSMYLKVVKDSVVEIDTTISFFIPRKQKKKIKSAIINRKFADYEKLVISVYDKNNIIDFHVDALIYIK